MRLLVASPEQATYELLRPVVLFGQPILERAGEPGVPEPTLRRKAARFDAIGMHSLFAPDDPPAPERRVLPLGIRRAIVALKAEYPPLGPFEIARICHHRFDRPVSYHTVAKALAGAIAPAVGATVPALLRHARSGRAAQCRGEAVSGWLATDGNRRLPGDLAPDRL